MFRALKGANRGGMAFTKADIKDTAKTNRLLSIFDNPDQLVALFQLREASFQLSAYNQLFKEYLSINQPKNTEVDTDKLFTCPFGSFLQGQLIRCLENNRKTTFDTSIETGMGRCYFKGFVFPAPEIGGSAGDYIFVATDTTEQQMTVEQLEVALMQAQLAARSRSEFVSNMSHELRTPLNAIMGFADMMKAELFGPIGNDKYHSYVDNIIESAHNLLENINDVLEVANIDLSLSRLKEEDFDLVGLIKDTVAMTLPKAIAADVTLKKYLLPVPLVMRGDAIKLRQVISNLLINAIKYTPPGGRIDITCSFSSQGDIQVTVHDTGNGIPQKDLEKITEAFQQTGNCYTRGAGGIGLGLALSKAFINLHGGRIAIDSREEQGTKVTLTMPASRIIGYHLPDSYSEQILAGA